MRRVAWVACFFVAAACGGASRSKVRQVGGILEISPADVDFGDVALGKEASTVLTLQNTGIMPMSVAELTQFADDAFDVQGLPVTLEPGASAQVAIRYRPNDLGAHAASLDLTTDTPKLGSPSVALRGHAVKGLATLSGDTFDFGDVVISEKSAQTFSLSNNDGHALTSVRIQVPVGGDSTAFTVKPPGDLPLQPEQSMTVTIVFQPDHEGDFAATVPVTPCPTCTPRNVSLTGRGVTRLLDVQPAAIDFGQVLLGQSAQQPVTLTNLSKASLSLQSLVQSGSADFALTLTNVSYPMALAPGQSLTAMATFTPHALANQNAQATLAASDGAPGIVAMTGTGIGPVLQVSPKSVFVGPTAIGTSRSATVTLTNVGLDPAGSNPLTVSNLSISSSDPAWSVQTSAPVSVGAPGSSATVQVTFTPTQAGLSSTTLVIDSNDGLHPQVKVPLAATGRALQPCTLSIAPGTNLDFGPTPLFKPTVQGVELTNTTQDDCVIGDPVLTTQGGFQWPGGVAPSGRTLAPGGRMSVRVELVTQAVQAYSGTVQFYVSNAQQPAITLNLTGSGDGGCFYVSPGTVGFGATTLGCAAATQNAYAVNHCAYPVTVSQVSTSGGPFSTNAQVPFTVPAQTSQAIPVSYQPATAGDDVGTLTVVSSDSATPRQVGLTGGAQTAATVLDQWDQSTPKVDMLIVIDNSGSMAEEQNALAQNLDHLWNRIALANADFHIAVTTTGMDAYTSGWSQCPGGAEGGEGGRFFPVDNTHPRLLTPQTPDVKTALFQNTAVGQCHWKEQFTEPVVAALTDPLIDSTKAPGTPWPSDGNAGFLRDDARLALMAVSDSDDDIDETNPPPVSYLINQLKTIKHGALDLVSFAGIVATEPCSTSEAVGSRYMQIANALGGQIYDICQLDSFGALLDNALGELLQPLSSFPLSTYPKDPTAIQVAVNGAIVTNWTYDAGANRVVFPSGAIPAPGSHVTARYEPACK